MELEEMKLHWTNLSKEVEQQKILTDNIIMEMTKERYVSKLSKITVPETLGAIICFAFALFIMINITKLEPWYLMACGIFTIIYLISLPILSLRTIYKMKNINNTEHNFKETLLNYAKYKKRYLLIQNSSIFFSLLLLVTSLPVSGKILSNKNLFMQNNVWYWYIPLMVVLLFFFYKWGLKCYTNITNSAESLLKDLEKNSR